jgi:excisionase family DNA binding protein
MMLSLQEAADLARVNKSTLFRAIKSGKISARRDEHNQWRLDPAEVARVYPIAVADAEQQHAMPRKRDRTDELVAQLREQLADLRREVDRAHNDADRARNDAETWRNAFETERSQRLALAAPADAPAATPATSPQAAEKSGRLRRAWRWMRATG